MPEAPASVNFAQTIYLALDAIGALVPHDAAAVLLLRDERAHLIALCGMPDAALAVGDSFALNVSPLLSCARDAIEPLAIAHPADGDPLFGCLLGSAGTHAIASPLRAQGSPQGLLVLVRRADVAFSASERGIVAGLAHQTALLLNHARQHEDAQRRALHLQVAGQIGRQLTFLQDLDQLLAESVKAVREKFGYYQVHIFLIDPATNELVLRQSSGSRREGIRRDTLRLKVGVQGITGWVAAQGEPLLCNDIANEPRFFSSTGLSATKAELAVPLRLGDCVIGVLDIKSDR